MTDVDEKNWVSLRDHMEEKFIAVEKQTNLLAEGMNLRLESMNQFREDLRKQAISFQTRVEFQMVIDRVQEDIRSLRESRALLEGRASQLSVNITFLFALAGLLLAMMNLIFHT